MSLSRLAVPPASERREGPPGPAGRGGGRHRREPRRAVRYVVGACVGVLAFAGLAAAAIGLHRSHGTGPEHRVTNVSAYGTPAGGVQPRIGAPRRSHAATGLPSAFAAPPSSALLFAPAPPPSAAGRTATPSAAGHPSPSVTASLPSPRVSPPGFPFPNPTPVGPTPVGPTPMPSPEPSTPTPTLTTPSPTSASPSESGFPSASATASGSASPLPAWPVRLR
jgi:hypothetical protein